jgi:hypothetical protein
LGGNLVLVVAYKKDDGKETMLEVSKRLKEQHVKDVDLETQSKSNVPVATASGMPLKSAKPSKKFLEKHLSAQSPISSPKSPSSSPNLYAISPQLPKKVPRPAKWPIEQKEMVEIPVEMKPHSPPLVSLANSHTEGDIDSPAPSSANTSESSSKGAIDPLVVMPITLSNPPSPAIPKEKPKVDNKAGEPKVEAKSEVKPQPHTKRSSTAPTKRIGKNEAVPDTPQGEPMPRSATSVSAPAPALVGTSLPYFHLSQHIQGEIQDR